MNEKQRTILSALALIALVLLVFGRLCSADFVQFDDPQTIANNPALNPPELAKILAYWTKPDLNLYIPLTYSVWGALAFLAHVEQPDVTGSLLNPWLYHAANVALHCMVVLIVFAILRSIVPCIAAAWIGAAVFATHPLQVESVAWASGTKDLLCGLFTFASILALIRYRQSTRTRWVVLGGMSVLAACLSKPTGIVAPVLAVVMDVLIHRTPLGRSLVALSSWLVIATVFAIVGMLVQPPLLHETPPIWLRPLVALDALAFYTWKLVWPAQLSVDYGRTPARIRDSGAIWWTWLVPIVIAIVATRLRRDRSRYLVTGLAIFVVGVAPVLGLIPFTFQTISTVADHYIYPSMLGIALLVSWMASAGRGPRWTVLAIVTVLSIRAFFAGAVWANDDTLFANAISVNPRSAFAHTNWGVSLARRGDDEAAVDHFRRAVAADSDYAFGHANLASMLRARGQHAEAAQEYRELLRVYRTQRSFDPQLGEDLQRIIDHLENMSTRPTSKEVQ